VNPNGCWDWWGYTGSHFADKRGVQMRAIRNMIDRLVSGASP
jgi:poly(3-hydroxybutyrate) depolymerase